MVVAGRVTRGKKAATALGYPTANIVHASRGLAPGIFLCRSIIGTRLYRGLAVVGMWQQENGEPSLEAHFLDFNGDVYDERLVVVIGEKIRDLAVFSTTEALVAQIKKDVEAARRLFG